MLSDARTEARLNNLSSMARKVYEAIPAAESWSLSFIQSEISRTSSSGRDARTVLGCIRCLIDSGLATEPSRGQYQRTQRREPKKAAPQPKPQDIDAPDMKNAPTAATPAPTENPKPIAILSKLATRARGLAKELTILADDLDTSALEIDEGIAASNADNEKLRQLQQLLKSLG